jgi:hypothetical protein
LFRAAWIGSPTRSRASVIGAPTRAVTRPP